MVGVDGVLGAGVHCDTGVQRSPNKSFRMNVMDPFRVRVAWPIKLTFPPAPNVTGPLKVNKVTISPGPRLLRMVVIGVGDELSAIEWAPRILIEVEGDINVVIPEVGGPAQVSQYRLS